MGDSYVTCCPLCLKIRLRICTEESNIIPPSSFPQITTQQVKLINHPNGNCSLGIQAEVKGQRKGCWRCFIPCFKGLLNSRKLVLKVSIRTESRRVHPVVLQTTLYHNIYNLKNICLFFIYYCLLHCY